MSEETTEDTVETRTGRIWLADGFLYVSYDPGAELDVEDAHADTDIMQMLAGGRRRPALVDISRVKKVSAEARRVYAGPRLSDSVVALALVVGSPVSRIIGNFYLGINRPRSETRLFGSRSEARAWLAGFVT